MKIRAGDTVLVISGKDKGKTGTVVRALETQNRVVVEGINMRTRHMRKTMDQAGQKIRYEASIHVSNVMILDPKTKKPTRIRYAVDAKTGKKQRVAAVSGEVIAKAATTAAKKPAKKTEAKADAPKTEKAEAKKTEAKKEEGTTSAPPKKEAFWKRVTGRGKKADDTGETRTEGVETHPTNAPVRRSRESS